MCIDISECNGRGFCLKGECLCDVAWFGDTCADNLKTFLPNGFLTYKVIFLIIYSFIALFSFFRLYLKIKKEKHLFARSNFVFVIKTLRSPYNLTMLSILAIAFTRILWLAIDPFSYNDVFHRSVERLFFESTYSLLFLVYAIVLWVWYAIYDELSLKNRKRSGMRLTFFKTKVKIFVLTVIVTQITTSVLKGFHDEDYRWVTLFIYVILFFIFVIVTLEYIVYGWLLYRCITDQEETINNKYDRLKSSLGQTGQAAAAYQKKATGQSGIEADASRYLASIAGKFDEKDRSSFNDSEKQDIMQPMQQPDSPDMSDSKSRELSRYGSEAQRRVAFKQSSQHVIIEGMEELEEDNSFAIEEVHRGPRFKSTPPAYKENAPRSIATFYSLKKAPDSHSYKKHSSIFDNDAVHEREIRDIVRRHEKYFKPVEIIEPKYEDIAEDMSVIIDDSEDVMWDFVDEEELKKQEEQARQKEERKEEIKLAVTRMRMQTVVIKYMNAVKKNLADTFQMKLLDDVNYLKNHQEITKNDKIIIKKIMSLTIIAISLEILFGIVTILVFYSSVLQSPVGMIFSMWMTGFLEVFAVFSIFMLFSIVQTQEKENLRQIMRIGQNNRINQLYGFVLPRFLRQEESKRQLERSINQMTAKYIKSWTKVHG